MASLYPIIIILYIKNLYRVTFPVSNTSRVVSDNREFSKVGSDTAPTFGSRAWLSDLSGGFGSGVLVCVLPWYFGAEYSAWVFPGR